MPTYWPKYKACAVLEQSLLQELLEVRRDRMILTFAVLLKTFRKADGPVFSALVHDAARTRVIPA